LVARGQASLEAYRQGRGVDVIGGAEAIISHLVTQELGVPCAHAPAMIPDDLDESVSPRCCAEELGHTFLPCVLANLNKAPSFEAPSDKSNGSLWAPDVRAIVVPASACGGSAVLSLSRRRGVIIVVVEENKTVMGATPEVLGLDRSQAQGGCRVVRVANYLEAAGVLAAHRAGLLAESLRPHHSAVTIH